MPDRVVRDEMLTSERYWSVPESAQLLFHHLILVVDDYGNTHAGYFVIRSKCYAGRHVENAVIDKLIGLLADADLVRLYEIDGVRYLHIPRFRQRLRLTKRKFPPSPWDTKQTDTDNSAGQPSVIGPAEGGHVSAEVKRNQRSEGSEGNRHARTRKTSLPNGFSISDRVRAWAAAKGYDRLEQRLEHFKGYSIANAKTYCDWDQAFMNAIRDDWARLRVNGGTGSARGRLAL